MALAQPPATPGATSCTELISESLQAARVSAAEARIAFALSMGPARGTRNLERASGLSRVTVMDTVPAEGQSSELLSCLSRGDNEFNHSRPMEVAFRYRSDPDHGSTTSLSDGSYDQGCLSDVLSSSSVDPVAVSFDKYARARANGLKTTAVLDPSLDLWSNTEQASVGEARAGSQGWVLAVVYGFEATEVTLATLAALWGLGERATRAAVQRLERAGWLSRRRLGRSTVVLVDFSTLPELMALGTFTWSDRAARVNELAFFEGARLKRRREKIGFRAWLVIRQRAEKVAMLPPDCDPRWRRLLSHGTEQEIYEMLSAGEQTRRSRAA